MAADLRIIIFGGDWFLLRRKTNRGDTEYWIPDPIDQYFYVIALKYKPINFLIKFDEFAVFFNL